MRNFWRKTKEQTHSDSHQQLRKRTNQSMRRLLPVPQEGIDRNPNLSQNAGY
ncbi:MAG: RagB/SusD family nutrient uptake outer membrane protein [Prolixibacteraceae bacterium]|nr:RagB/SusD family nutrient uptake outer membrane protein [Prolixibacteraceae bacterium]